MSSRWPQGQQHQRSPYATYDQSWPPEGDGGQSWQDAGWQDAGWQDPDPQQWSAGPGVARSGGRTAQAVADPWAPPRTGRQSSDQDQRDWDQGAGGYGDDADLEWISYLTGGRSAQPKPEAVPSPRPDVSGIGRREPRHRDLDRDRDRDGAARRGGRSERLRSRRGHDRPEPADPADPGREPGAGDAGRRAAADPGFGWPAAAASAPAPAVDPGLARPAPDRGYRRDATDPGLGGPPSKGRHGRAAADQAYGRAAADQA
jgi:hypothetical protein